MVLWKVQVPSGGRGGLIFVECASWFGARGICRRLYQDEALEKNWREMQVVEPSVLMPGDTIFYESGYNEIGQKIVPAPPSKKKSKKPTKKRAKPRKK
jgi:hypothetical protein